MHVSALKDSKFLKKDDCGKGILVTIRDVHEENVAKEGAPAENKWCISFNEQEKPMVLNSTNIQAIAAICGSEETDDWKGHKIVLYHDPNVSYAGKLIGGIRVRAPRNQPAQAAPAQRQNGPPPRQTAPPAQAPAQNHDRYEEPQYDPSQDADPIPF